MFHIQLLEVLELAGLPLRTHILLEKLLGLRLSIRQPLLRLESASVLVFRFLTL